MPTERLRLRTVIRGWVRRMLQQFVLRALDPSRVLANPYVSGKLVPAAGNRSHTISPRARPANGWLEGDALPLPPKELWEGYGETDAEFLACGREDMDSMLRTVQRAGVAPEGLRRVLEFGCAAARMLRFFPRTSEAIELWGADIKAAHIDWCQRHLGPPFRFVATTTAPHLPFEDNYFDLVYCGSVFTHISDLADAWLLELRRILRPGGHAYVTIHDRHTIELLLTKYAERPDLAFLRDMLRRLDAETSVLSQAFGRFAIGIEPRVQVFYDAEDLVRRWSTFATVVSITQEAYGYQTALVIRK